MRPAYLGEGPGILEQDISNFVQEAVLLSKASFALQLRLSPNPGIAVR
jgi:hypothetical protein